MQQSDDEGNTSSGGNPPAWVDSDDERIVISLASNPRLRKLRVSEAEDLVNGKEYTRRLRRQFERLNPIPDWANPSATNRPRKRRRTSGDPDSSSHSSSGDEMAVDDDDLTVQPLAKLLQNTDSLTRTTSTTSSGRKRLRPEVIDIQRTKDVGGIQPVSLSRLPHRFSVICSLPFTEPPPLSDHLLTLTLVGNRISLISSDLPSSALLRSRLDSVPPSYLSDTPYPQPSSHNSSPSLDAP